MLKSLAKLSNILGSDNLLAGQQKIDLCHIKNSFQIYQLTFQIKS